MLNYSLCAASEICFTGITSPSVEPRARVVLEATNNYLLNKVSTLLHDAKIQELPQKGETGNPILCNWYFKARLCFLNV